MLHTDVHSHILPGIDDGAKDLQVSEKIISTLFSQGVEHIAATPHFRSHLESIDDFCARRNKAYELMCGHFSYDIMKRITVGAEVALEYRLSDVEKINQLTYGNTNYILLELPFRQFSQRMIEEINNIQYEYKLNPVIAHIDRYVEIFSEGDYDVLLSLGGVIFQVNNSAFLQRKSRRLVSRLIENGLPFVLGSDSHNTTSRAPDFDVAQRSLSDYVPHPDTQRFINALKNANSGMLDDYYHSASSPDKNNAFYYHAEFGSDEAVVYGSDSDGSVSDNYGVKNSDVTEYPDISSADTVETYRYGQRYGNGMDTDQQDAYVYSGNMVYRMEENTYSPRAQYRLTDDNLPAGYEHRDNSNNSYSAQGSSYSYERDGSEDNGNLRALTDTVRKSTDRLRTGANSFREKAVSMRASFDTAYDSADFTQYDTATSATQHKETELNQSGSTARENSAITGLFSGAARENTGRSPVHSGVLDTGSERMRNYTNSSGMRNASAEHRYSHVEDISDKPAISIKSFIPLLLFFAAAVVFSFVLPHLRFFNHVVEISSSDISYDSEFIRYRDEGADVTALQKKLYTLGYLDFDDVTGCFDDVTVSAVNSILELLNMQPVISCSYDNYSMLMQLTPEQLVSASDTDNKPAEDTETKNDGSDSTTLPAQTETSDTTTSQTNASQTTTSQTTTTSVTTTASETTTSQTTTTTANIQPNYVRILENQTRLRSKPNMKSTVLFWVNYGEEYHFIEEFTDSDGTVWYKLKYNNYCDGYVLAEKAELVNR